MKSGGMLTRSEEEKESRNQHVTCVACRRDVAGCSLSETLLTATAL